MKRVAVALLLLAACREEAAEIPDPVMLTDDAVSHFCLMQIADHEGPKAQIHLDGLPAPIFFAQVRDALAYLRSAERAAPVAVVYVSDMGAAASWEAPGRDNWIDAEAAFFVVGADVTGGMGAPEIAPFGTEAAAASFARRHGGAVMALPDIPPEAVLGGIDIRLPEEVERNG